MCSTFIFLLWNSEVLYLEIYLEYALEEFFFAINNLIFFKVSLFRTMYVHVKGANDFFFLYSLTLLLEYNCSVTREAR